MRESNRKQALVPAGATVLEPVGTAPGLVVPPGDGPTVVVLPGPPRELQPMWETALRTAPEREWPRRRTYAADAAAVRHPGIRDRGDPARGRGAERSGRPLEITTCLRRGEVEVVTRFEPQDSAPPTTRSPPWSETGTPTRSSARTTSASTPRSPALLRDRGPDYRDRGVLHRRPAGRPSHRPWRDRRTTCSAASSCTPTRPRRRSPAWIPGSSRPTVPYRPRLRGAGRRCPGALGADVGVGITGIAGPGGGSDEKPVGLVCFSVALAGGERWDRSVLLPGDRLTIRERTTTVVMHGLRRLLREAAAVHRA